MLRIKAQHNRIRLSDRRTYPVLVPLLMFATVPTALIAIAVKPSVVAFALLAGIAIVFLVLHANAIEITFDAQQRAFSVRERNLFRTRMESYRFDELRGPLELAVAPVTGRLMIIAPLADGRTLRLSYLRVRHDQRAVVSAVEAVNEAIFGTRIPTRIANMKD